MLLPETQHLLRHSLNTFIPPSHCIRGDFCPCPSATTALVSQADSYFKVQLWSTIQMQVTTLSFEPSQTYTCFLFNYSGIMAYIHLPPLEAGTLSSSNPYYSINKSEKVPSCLFPLFSLSILGIRCPEAVSPSLKMEGHRGKHKCLLNLRRSLIIPQGKKKKKKVTFSFLGIYQPKHAPDTYKLVKVGVLAWENQV